MKGKVLKLTGANSGRLKSTDETIIIKKGRYIQNSTSHPLKNCDTNYYKRVYSLENKDKTIIYWFSRFGSDKPSSGEYIGFNFWENQRFLWLQNDNWIQKEENIRYMVNLIFLTIGVYIGYKSL